MMLVASLLLLLIGCGTASDAEGLVKEAEGLLKQRKIREGAVKLREAYAKAPDNLKIITLYARVELYLGKTNSAMTALNRGLKTLSGEKLKQLARYRAFLLVQAGQREAALQAIEQGLKRWPGDRGFMHVQQQAGRMPGAVAPDFSGQRINGRSVSLKQYRGRVVLIDFWASWCSPCRESMPHLKELYTKYRGKGLVLLGVNLDKTRAAASGFMKQAGVNFPIIFGPENQKTAATYGVQGIPATVLVDKQGVIRYSGHPMGLQERVIRGLL